MNQQAKPEPPPKQKRPHARDISHACTGKCPCGGVCILDATVRHTYHVCHNEHCKQCHSPARFGRMADPLPELEPVGWVKA
jgi:hypothetical protein